MIVLTGGAGFIGSCFLRRLNDAGISDVLIVDRLGYGKKWKNLVHKKFVDFVEPEHFLQALKSGEYGASIEVIVHLGARTDTSEKDAQFLLTNNFTYSCELLRYAEPRGIRFIYASSAAIYGRGVRGFQEDDFSNRDPLNAYAFSKYAFDQWVWENGYFQKSVVGLIFFNVYGPNEYHKAHMASMVYKAYTQFRKNGVVRLYKSTTPEFADGEQKRDFIYVKDVVEILWNMLHYGEIRGLFNVGTGTARSWNELVQCVAEALGVEPKVEYIDMPEEVQEQYQNYTQAEIRKLQATRAYVPARSLEEGIKDYVQQHLQSDNPYW